MVCAVRHIFIVMAVQSLRNIIIENDEHARIDYFIQEYSEFNPKHEKDKLKLMIRRLQELKRNASHNLFTNETLATQDYFKLKKEIVSLKEKIDRYSENKEEIDTLVRKHDQYLLHKHGKIV